MRVNERERAGMERDAEVRLAVTPSEPASTWMERIEEHPKWLTLQRVPLLITAGVPLPRFKVQDLLRLAVGQVIESSFAASEDVPVKVGATQFAWSEFEVVGEQIAVRLTRLA